MRALATTTGHLPALACAVFFASAGCDDLETKGRPGDAPTGGFAGFGAFGGEGGSGPRGTGGAAGATATGDGGAGGAVNFPGWCGDVPCAVPPTPQNTGGMADVSPYQKLDDAVWLVRGITSDGLVIYARADGLFAVSVKGGPPTQIAPPGSDGVVVGAVVFVWGGTGIAPLDLWSSGGVAHLSDASFVGPEYVATDEKGTVVVYTDGAGDAPVWTRAAADGSHVVPLGPASSAMSVAYASGRFVVATTDDTGPIVVSLGTDEDQPSLVCATCGPTFFTARSSPWVAVDASTPGGGASLAWISGGNVVPMPGANLHSAGALPTPNGDGVYYRTDAGDLAYSPTQAFAPVILAPAASPNALWAVAPDGNHALVSLSAGGLFLAARDTPGLKPVGNMLDAIPAADPFTADGAYALFLQTTGMGVQLAATPASGGATVFISGSSVAFALGGGRVFYEESLGTLGTIDLAKDQKKTPIIAGASVGPDRMAVTPARDRVAYVTGTQRLFTFAIP